MQRLCSHEIQAAGDSGSSLARGDLWTAHGHCPYTLLPSGTWFATKLCLCEGCFPDICKNTLTRRGWSSRLGDTSHQASCESRQNLHVIFPNNRKQIMPRTSAFVPNGIQNKIIVLVTVDVRSQACVTWRAQHNVRMYKQIVLGI